MGSSAVTWLEIPDPVAVIAPIRKQVEASRFRRGEGAWYDYGVVYFVTTSDDRVWAYDTSTSTMSVVDNKAVTGGELEEPDNITVSPVNCSWRRMTTISSLSSSRRRLRDGGLASRRRS